MFCTSMFVQIDWWVFGCWLRVRRPFLDRAAATLWMAPFLVSLPLPQPLNPSNRALPGSFLGFMRSRAVIFRARL